jgi:hypothetical protein
MGSAQIITQKVYFSGFNASLRWLNNAVGVYSVQVSLLLIGQQGLADFFSQSNFVSTQLHSTFG